MITARSHSRVWLAAVLFPLKLYTVLGFVPLLIWRAKLPPFQMGVWRLGFDDPVWERAILDYNYIAQFIVLGYFCAAGVLVIGGMVQALGCPRRRAFLNVAFGSAALIIGLLLAHFGYEQDFATL